MQIDIESMKSTLELYWDLNKRKPLAGNELGLFKSEFKLYIEQVDFKDKSKFIELT